MEKSSPDESRKLDEDAGLSPTQQRRLERVYEKSSIATIVFSSGEELLYLNDAAKALFEGRDLRSSPGSSGQGAALLQSLSPLIQNTLNRLEGPSLWLRLAASEWPPDLEIHLALLPLAEDDDFILCQFRERPTTPLRDDDQRVRRRLRAVLENLPIAVLLYDSNAQILEYNEQVLDLLERDSWETINQRERPYQVCDPQGRPLPRSEWPLLRSIREGAAHYHGEVYLDFSGRQKVLSITVTPIFDEASGEVEYLVTGEDITRRVEEGRQKDEFLTIASHELRGPLTPLAGLIQLAIKQAKSSDVVDPQLLHRASSQITRLHRLIDGLLDLSRIERGQFAIHRREIDLTEFLKQVVDPWRSGPQRERLELRLPEESIFAFIDPDRMDQVLTNVIDNAFKHGRSDGTVLVSLERSSSFVRFLIRDEGPGIPEELLQDVFQLFVFGRSEAGGGSRAMSLGLGLYLARQIIESHGGRIELDSAQDAPTVVTLELPLQPA